MFTAENKIAEQNNSDLIPFSIACIGRINNHTMTSKPLLVLFDSGSQTTWMSRKILPTGVTPRVVPKLKGVTLAGTFTSNTQVEVQQLSFPELYKQRTIDKHKVMLFASPCRYDIIVGRDLLHRIGLNILFKTATITWDDEVSFF